MFRCLLIFLAVVSMGMGICLTSLQAQQSIEPPASGLQSSEDIPFQLLQQIARGYGSTQIKSDLSEAQIEAMKKVLSAPDARETEIFQLSAALSQSPLRNRRFRAAIDQWKTEKQEHLREEWLKIITPEQQKVLKRRNRQAILQASLESRQTDRSLLDNQESIDQLMTNEDMLSVIERPAIQDLLEITDDQFTKIEELQANAQADALLVLKRASASAKPSQESPVASTAPSDIWKRLNERTMKVLSAEQSTAYLELLSNPDRLQKLISNGNADAIQAGFRLMMPHGASRSISTEVRDGQLTTTVVLHNAFENPELIRELKITDTQQRDITKILDELRPEIVAEIEANQKAYHQRETEKRKGFDELLKAHNQQFHAKAISLLTVPQLAVLEKERYRGLGMVALTRPQVVATLKLTEEQSKSIADILAQPAPNLPLPMILPSSTPEEFQKHAEEFHKRARENGEKLAAHHRKLSEEIHAVMSEQQCAKFTEMTGFVLQKNSDKNEPVTSN